MASDILNGRIAVVTGGNRGLGKAIALALGGAGATVVLVARDRDALQAMTAELTTAGTVAHPHSVDVTNEAEIERLAAWLRSDVGRVDILVNAAGINLRKPLVDFSLEEWRRVMDTNLTSAFLMCRAVVPLMRGRDYGRIINITSTMSHVSLSGRSAYSASKAGLLGLTRALALELAADGITVSAISPGPFATDLNAPLMRDPQLNAHIVSRIPLGRWGDPRDIGELALFLCSDAGRFVTGSDLLIDGGWTAQ